MNKNISKLILENAQKLKNLEEESKTSDTKSVFLEKYDQLAFPGGLEKGISSLKEGNPNAVTTALEFLKINPYFFRSGYIKQEIARILKQISLNNNQIEELQDILITLVQGKSHREFIEYCRLAKKVSDQKFITKLEKIIKESKDTAIQKQAQQMLDVINN